MMPVDVVTSSTATGRLDAYSEADPLAQGYLAIDALRLILDLQTCQLRFETRYPYSYSGSKPIPP